MYNKSVQKVVIFAMSYAPHSGCARLKTKMLEFGALFDTFKFQICIVIWF